MIEIVTDIDNLYNYLIHWCCNRPTFNSAESSISNKEILRYLSHTCQLPMLINEVWFYLEQERKAHMLTLKEVLLSEMDSNHFSQTSYIISFSNEAKLFCPFMRLFQSTLLHPDAYWNWYSLEIPGIEQTTRY